MPPYPQCPKCGHSPLPADQSLPAACPSCGLVLAKFIAPLPPRASRNHTDDSDEPSRLIAFWGTL